MTDVEGTSVVVHWSGCLEMRVAEFDKKNPSPLLVSRGLMVSYRSCSDTYDPSTGMPEDTTPAR